MFGIGENFNKIKDYTILWIIMQRMIPWLIMSQNNDFATVVDINLYHNECWGETNYIRSYRIPWHKFIYLV